MTSQCEMVETEHFGAIPVRKRDCPLCNCDNQTVPASRYSYQPWTIKECSGCGFVYIDRAPTYEIQFTTMAWERTTKVEEQRRVEIRPISYTASKRTRFRKNLLPKRMMLDYIAGRIQGGNVIDLGCGDGHSIMGFPPSFIPFGVEISSQLAVSADRAFAPRGGYAINAACVEGLRQFPESFFASGLSAFLS